jgi:hypothetical protein
MREYDQIQRQSAGLQHGFRKALDTPLQSAIYTVQQLLHSYDGDAETCADLSAVLRELTAAHPYMPTFNFSSADLAKDACEWISDTLAGAPDAADDNGARSSTQPSGAALADYELQSCRVDRDPAMEKALQSLGFDSWELHGDVELDELVVAQFVRFNLPQIFHIPEKVLRSFVAAVRGRYRASNPFHNFRHGFDVLQLVCALCSGTALRELRSLEKLALLIAAICVDLDHGGVDDGFLINTDSPLAQTYSGTHINESHHCAVLWKLLAEPQLNILGGVASQQWREVRKIIISILMATPMGKHFDVITKLSSMCESGPINFETQEDRTDLLCAIVHTADIAAAVCRPKAIADRWTHLYMEEFYRQGDAERALGIAVSPMCGRVTNITDAHSAAATVHCDYCEYLVVPMIDVLIGALGKGEPTLIEAKRYLHANLLEWQKWRSRDASLDMATILGVAFQRSSSPSVEEMSASTREEVVIDHESSRADITLHNRVGSKLPPTSTVAQVGCCAVC